RDQSITCRTNAAVQIGSNNRSGHLFRTGSKRLLQAMVFDSVAGSHAPQNYSCAVSNEFRALFAAPLLPARDTDRTRPISGTCRKQSASGASTPSVDTRSTLPVGRTTGDIGISGKRPDPCVARGPRDTGTTGGRTPVVPGS